MKIIQKKYLFVTIFSFFFALCACVKHTHVEASDIECLKNGELHMQHVDRGRVYLNVQGISPSRRFLGALQKVFAARGFAFAAKPSTADLIVQISICHAGGMNRSDAERALESGYDSKVGITGDEVAGLVVDTLLVTRDVPQARSDEQRNLKTISQRSASGSSTLRLVLLSKKGISMQPVPLSFAHYLGETLCRYLDQK